METPAQTRRYVAMADLQDTWYERAGTGHKELEGLGTPKRLARFVAAKVYMYEHRSEIATEIRGLVRLGRTVRWANAINAWADAVLNAETPSECGWAFSQYSVYAAYAAK